MTASEDEVALFMAHEIRNVLAVISTLSLAGASGAGTEHETFAKIRKQCEIASGIVADVLALGASPLPAQAVQLSALLEDLSIPWQGDGDAVALGHAGLLTRVCSVLQDNAARAKPKDLAFTVWIARTETQVTLAFVDNGPGVPNALRAHIFERGVSAAESTGLGLYFARKVARAHDGDLTLAESHAGEGARFELTLPRYTSAERNRTDT